MATSIAAGTRAAWASTDYPSIFNSTEVRSENLSPFAKWRGALERSMADARQQQNCSDGLFSRCYLKDWSEFLDRIRGQDLMSQLSAVNREMNRRRYIIDPRNWGVPDYWATPLQFFRRQGDCEDYAIAKFLSLRALGVANDKMRIVVLQDLNLRIAHAILVVFNGGRAYVLDNQIKQVVAAERIRHYKPIYSINEEFWWRHRT